MFRASDVRQAILFVSLFSLVAFFFMSLPVYCVRRAQKKCDTTKDKKKYRRFREKAEQQEVRVTFKNYPGLMVPLVLAGFVLQTAETAECDKCIREAQTKKQKIITKDSDYEVKKTCFGPLRCCFALPLVIPNPFKPGTGESAYLCDDLLPHESCRDKGRGGYEYDPKWESNLGVCDDIPDEIYDDGWNELLLKNSISNFNFTQGSLCLSNNNANDLACYSLSSLVLDDNKSIPTWKKVGTVFGVGAGSALLGAGLVTIPCYGGKILRCGKKIICYKLDQYKNEILPRLCNLFCSQKGDPESGSSESSFASLSDYSDWSKQKKNKNRKRHGSRRRKKKKRFSSSSSCPGSVTSSSSNFATSGYDSENSVCELDPFSTIKSLSGSSSD